MDSAVLTQQISAARSDLGTSALNAQRRQLEKAANAQGLDAKTYAKIEEASKEYEAIFLTEMLGHMFKDINFGGIPGGETNSANEIYKDFLVKEYATTLANQGGVGLADDIKRQLIELQTGQTPQ